MSGIPIADQVKKIFSDAKSASDEAVKRETRKQLMVHDAAESNLVCAVMGHIREDDERGYGKGIVGLVASEKKGAIITVQGEHFNYQLSVPGLERAAEAITGEDTRKLLGRPGILGLVNQILDCDPHCDITLTDHSGDKDGGRSNYYRATTVDFAINAHPIQLEVLQDRNHKHRNHHGITTHAPVVEAFIREAPDLQVRVPTAGRSLGLSDSNSSFIVFGGTSDERHFNPGFPGFRALLSAVADLGGSAAVASAKPIEQRLGS